MKGARCSGGDKARRHAEAMRHLSPSLSESTARELAAGLLKLTAEELLMILVDAVGQVYARGHTAGRMGGAS